MTKTSDIKEAQKDKTFYYYSFLCYHHLLVATAKSLSGSFYNRSKQQLSTDCNTPATNGLYWVQDMQVCMIVIQLHHMIHLLLSGLL